MSYTTQECIFDLIAACGPQTHKELSRECWQQVPGYHTGGVTKALLPMVLAGLLEYEFDGAYWDLSDYGYELAAAPYRQPPRD